MNLEHQTLDVGLQWKDIWPFSEKSKVKEIKATSNDLEIVFYFSTLRFLKCLNGGSGKISNQKSVIVTEKSGAGGGGT